MGKAAGRVYPVRVSGPLAPFVAAFELKLKDAGYTPPSAVNQMRLVAHLSGWLDASRLELTDLTGGRIEEFFASRRARGCTWLVTRLALEPLLELLTELKALPAPELPAKGSPADVVLARFQRYLLDERGLAPSTASAYVFRARRFVAGCAHGAQLDALTTADVTRAILAESGSLSVGAAQFFVAALRSFLRFCSFEGFGCNGPVRGGSGFDRSTAFVLTKRHQPAGRPGPDAVLRPPRGCRATRLCGDCHPAPTGPSCQRGSGAEAR